MNSEFLFFQSIDVGMEGRGGGVMILNALNINWRRIYVLVEINFWQ